MSLLYQGESAWPQVPPLAVIIPGVLAPSPSPVVAPTGPRMTQTRVASVGQVLRADTAQMEMPAGAPPAPPNISNALENGK